MDATTTRGCLEPREVEQVARTAPGQLAPDLVAHLAMCATCRQRLLALDIPDRNRRTPGPPAPLMQRVARVLLVLAVIVLALISMLRLIG